MGQNLGYEVVAESVENEETCNRLAAMGCDIMQGFHLARPMPSDKAKAWTEKHLQELKTTKTDTLND